MSITDPKNTRISNAVHHPAEAADFNRGRSGYEVGPLAHARPGSGAYQWSKAINICQRGVVPGFGLAQQAREIYPRSSLPRCRMWSQSGDCGDSASEEIQCGSHVRAPLSS